MPSGEPRVKSVLAHDKEGNYYFWDVDTAIGKTKLEKQLEVELPKCAIRTIKPIRA